MMKKLRAFCAREPIRVRLIITTLSWIVLNYGLIATFGHRLPEADSNTPLFLRLHPERILAMLAAVLGMVRLKDHVQKGQDLIHPLLWILFASVIHLASIGVQLGWLSPGRG
jgi:hypothetical protein